MTEAEAESYADRIATGAAEDGIAWRLSAAEGEWLGRRYGAALTLGPGEHKLRDVARLIAEALL